VVKKKEPQKRDFQKRQLLATWDGTVGDHADALHQEKAGVRPGSEVLWWRKVGSCGEGERKQELRLVSAGKKGVVLGG